MRTVTLGSLNAVMPVVPAGVSGSHLYGLGTTDAATLQRNTALFSGAMGLTGGLIIGYLIWKR